MGEYAIRKEDNEKIKIGICESMFYIRYEDRNKVNQLPGSIDPQKEINLFWRLPFPGEDYIKIGEYREHNRGALIYKLDEKGRAIYYADPEHAEDPGTLQLIHIESGLMINAKCYHGEKLPTGSEDMKPFWNGKGYAYELAFVKNTKKAVLPIIRCRFCENMWRLTWDIILPHIHDAELKERLSKY